MNAAHENGAAALLANGQVLIAGNYDPYFGDGSAAELYDPTTGAWALTGSMTTGRSHFDMTVLTDGRVLAVGGGDGSNGYRSSAEIYNPATGVWSTTGSMHVARENFGLVTLPNGNVLAVGGDALNYSTGVDSVLSSAEIYNPSTGAWTYTGSMRSPRTVFTTTLLGNGEVLVTGGSSTSPTGGAVLSSVELYNPATGKWSSAKSMASARMSHTATLLGNGNVLVTGGYHLTTSSPYIATYTSSELYNPAANTWSSTGNLSTSRYGATATLLTNGTALVAGGVTIDSSGNAVELSSAEIYQP